MGTWKLRADNSAILVNVMGRLAPDERSRLSTFLCRLGGGNTERLLKSLTQRFGAEITVHALVAATRDTSRGIDHQVLRLLGYPVRKKTRSQSTLESLALPVCRAAIWIAQSIARLGPSGNDPDHIAGLKDGLQEDITANLGRPIALAWVLLRNTIEITLEVTFYRIPGLRGLMGDTTRYVAAGFKWAGGVGALLVSTTISSWATGSPAPIAIKAGIVTVVCTGLVGALWAWARDWWRRPSDKGK